MGTIVLLHDAHQMPKGSWDELRRDLGIDMDKKYVRPLNSDQEQERLEKGVVDFRTMTREDHQLIPADMRDKLQFALCPGSHPSSDDYCLWNDVTTYSNGDQFVAVGKSSHINWFMVICNMGSELVKVIEIDQFHDLIYAAGQNARDGGPVANRAF